MPTDPISTQMRRALETTVSNYAPLNAIVKNVHVCVDKAQSRKINPTPPKLPFIAIMGLAWSCKRTSNTKFTWKEVFGVRLFHNDLSLIGFEASRQLIIASVHCYGIDNDHSTSLIERSFPEWEFPEDNPIEIGKLVNYPNVDAAFTEVKIQLKKSFDPLSTEFTDLNWIPAQTPPITP